MMDELSEAERLAVAYAPKQLKGRYAAALALDGALRRVALQTREPLPAQLKLAWWREALARLPAGRDHPVLTMLSEYWAGDPAPLAGLVDAWEEVAVAEQEFAAASEALARQRGVVLAACAGVEDPGTPPAARTWTLATLAARAPSAQRDAMRAAARAIPTQRLPRALRPLAVLSGLARRALAAERAALVGDRWSAFAAMRLGIFGR